MHHRVLTFATLSASLLCALAAGVAAQRALPASRADALLDAGRWMEAEEVLYADVWGKPLRAGDRSIDVYVRKLRVKLEQALPAWRFIHTHVGFGYRLEPERSQHFHTADTPR